MKILLKSCISTQLHHLIYYFKKYNINYYIYMGQTPSHSEKQISKIEKNSEQLQFENKSSSNINNNSFEQNGNKQRISIESINNELDKNMNDLIYLLKRRRNLIESKKKKLKQQYLKKIDSIKKSTSNDLLKQLKNHTSDKNIEFIATNFDGFLKLKNIFKNIAQKDMQLFEKNQMNRYNQFWNGNKKIESELDQNLKRLRNLETHLQKIVDQEYEACNSINQNQENIRLILQRKQQNHIQKAQPYSKEKLKLNTLLKSKQLQKEKIKQQKRALIKKILQTLDMIKNSREERIDLMKDVVNRNFDLDLYDQFINNLEKNSRIKQYTQNLKLQENKLFAELEELSIKSEQIIKSLIEKQSEQAKKFLNLANNYKTHIKILLTEKILVLDILPQNITKNLPQFTKKCRQYKKIVENSIQQQLLLNQGIQKTKETTKDFEEILKKTQNQKYRKQKLLIYLQKMQEIQSENMNYEEYKRQLYLNIQNQKTEKKKLESQQADSIIQADLSNYKVINNQIDGINIQISKNQKAIEEIKSKVIQNQKIIQQTKQIMQSDFSDILKEVIPENWIKSHDLRKTDNITELSSSLKRSTKRMQADR